MGYKRAARVLFASADMRLAAAAVAAASRSGSGWLVTHAVRGDALADNEITQFDLIIVLDAPSHAALEAHCAAGASLPPRRFYACGSEAEVIERVNGMVNGMRMLARVEE